MDIIRTHGDEGILLLTLYGDNAVDFMKRAQTFGVDPTGVLGDPPLPGQSLNSWLLGISNSNNPVNKPLALSLSDSQINSLANLSVHRGETNEFVLGYYDPDKISGYIELANDRNASYFSVDNSLYSETGFSSDAGDFWLVNQQAITNAVDDRNVFVLNVKYDEIDTSKSTWAEVQLILSPGIDGGFDMLVPIELFTP